jgi:saccharopine dehydrogenase-like NADP-dependent oxidoreductase
MELPAKANWSAYLDAFLPHCQDCDTRGNLANYLGLDEHGPVMQKLDWLGLFDKNNPIGVSGRSPAATLQHLLEQKWKLGPQDKDMVVMWHRFRYAVEGQHQTIHASLGVIGEDTIHTAMARTVGLPIAMACKLLLNGTITDRGVLLPLKPVIYEPILDELEIFGVKFTEEEVEA